MSTVYITSINGKIYRENDTLVFSDIEHKRVVIFPHLTSEIIITGYVELTSYAVSCLIFHKINIFFLSKNGMNNAVLSGGEQKNVYLRKKQYDLLNNNEFIMSFVKQIIFGKISNQLNFMKRIASEKNIPDGTDIILEKMNSLLKKIDKIDNLKSIRGVEGMASKLYFEVLKYNILPDWAKFNGRHKNPPTDPVNSLLSLTYTLLSYKIETSIMLSGMDSYVGYLHNLEYGRKSLVFDLMEEFRTPVADRVVCFLINNKVFNQSDFEDISIPGTRNKAVYLKKGNIGKVAEYLEKRLDKCIRYNLLNKKMPIRKVINYQVEQFKRYVNSDITHYTPVILK